VRAIHALLLLGVGVAGAACSSVAASPPPRTHAADIPAVRRALEARLHARYLSYRWVACVANGRSFRGQPVVRCNVNFGDPHIVAYCSVLIDDQLVTQIDDGRVPCTADRAGETVVVVTGP
jgi:hypothetical protein